jgi:hypothetical protein
MGCCALQYICNLMALCSAIHLQSMIHANTSVHPLAYNPMPCSVGLLDTDDEFKASRSADRYVSAFT